MVIYNLKFNLNVGQNNTYSFGISSHYGQLQSGSNNPPILYSFDENFSKAEKAEARQNELLAACVILKINPTYHIKEVEIK